MTRLQKGVVGAVLLLLPSAGIFGQTDPSLGQLLDRLKNSPSFKLNRAKVEKGKWSERSVKGSLFPRLELFGSRERYSIPTALLPLPPTQVTQIARSGGGYPFSNESTKIGVTLSMPLFVKSIWDSLKKSRWRVKGIKAQAKLANLSLEVNLVKGVAQLNYLYRLLKALQTKATFLKQTIKAVEVGVKNGKYPQFQLDRLKDALSQVELQIAQVRSSIAKWEGEIYKLVGVEVAGPVSISFTLPQKGPFFPLKPLKFELESSRYGVAVARDRFLPQLFLEGTGYRVFAKSYDNGATIAKNYAKGGVYLKWTILDRKGRGEVEQKKVERLQALYSYQQKKRELEGLESSLWKQLSYFRKGVEVGRREVNLRRKLLSQAKVAFKLHRMRVEDYLKYEDNLVEAQAQLAQIEGNLAVVVANLALLYGVDLEKVFK